MARSFVAVSRRVQNEMESRAVQAGASTGASCNEVPPRQRLPREASRVCSRPLFAQSFIVSVPAARALFARRRQISVPNGQFGSSASMPST